MIDTKELIDFLKARKAIGLIGVDGMPVSGKSTLADRLIDQLGADVIYLDDFVLPQHEWPSPLHPGFPFPYIRHEAFFTAVENLARTGTCSYQVYDWETGALGPWKEVNLSNGPVVVEGVSALAARIAPLHDVKIWVESDATTTLDAALARGVGPWERQWRDLFMPSVDLYMASDPRAAADFILSGRGARAP